MKYTTFENLQRLYNDNKSSLPDLKPFISKALEIGYTRDVIDEFIEGELNG
jgi:hypothetical protein